MDAPSNKDTILIRHPGHFWLPILAHQNPDVKSEILPGIETMGF